MLEAAFDFVDQTDSAVIVGGAVIGTADGVIDGAVDTVKLAADVASDPVGSYRRAKEIIDYARENPEEFFAALTEEGVKAFRALQSDFNEFQFALATDSRITSADSVNDVLNLFDRGALFETSEDLGHTIGPFIVGAGAGGALLKVGRVGDIISDIAKSGKRPETPDVDAPNTGDRGANADGIEADAPETPDRPNGNSGNDSAGERSDGSDTTASDTDVGSDEVATTPPKAPKLDCLVNPASCRGPDGKWTHWTNPETGKVEPIGTAKNYDAKFRIEDDHVFPQAEIGSLPGFGDLTKAQQNELLNLTDNFQPLPKPLNCSKGCKLGVDWTELKSQGVKIDPAYRLALQAKQDDVREAIVEKIAEFKRKNSTGG